MWLDPHAVSGRQSVWGDALAGLKSAGTPKREGEGTLYWRGTFMAGAGPGFPATVSDMEPYGHEPPPVDCCLTVPSVGQQ